jgi:hypothetical protein
VNNASTNILRILTLLLLVVAAEPAAAQLPVRTRYVHLFSDNNTNYNRLMGANGMAANWTLITPPTEGATGSMLVSTVAAGTATLSWLAPGVDGQQLVITGGVPAWSGANLAWLLGGNTLTANQNLGTLSNHPVPVVTNAVERMRVTETGLVGIGTSTPATLLEVHNGSVTIGTSGAGTAGSVRWEEDAANGNEYVALLSPSSLTSSTTYTLPNATGTAGQALLIASAPVPTATAATLEWGNVATQVTANDNIVADNQNVAVGALISFLRLTSNDNPGNRTVVLANGLRDAQVLVIRCVAANPVWGVQIVDGGNVQSSGDANLNNADTITLIWDATSALWIELSRRNN